jgi:hypothetical protein
MLVDPSGILTTVTGAIQQAARLTGASFQYLLATAQVESNLNPNAQVSTSSARGLFQFIEQTWLATLKEQGPALGYGPYAAAISRLPSGQYAASDPEMHRRIMNLRSDPTANAVMAGAFTRANAAKLTDRLGRDPTEGELYVAHFLGSAGASRLIDLAETRPLTPAAQVFPGAARANPSIFYDRQGHARSAGQVYHSLVGRYDVVRAGRSDAPAVAALADSPTAAPAVPDPAALAQTYAEAARLAEPAGQPGDGGPMFHSLFSTGGARPEALAPLVSALWSVPATDPAQAPGADDSFGLFQDRAPDARALFRGRI